MQKIWKCTVSNGDVIKWRIIYGLISHPGSGSDRTIASERQVMALVMLYIGRLVTCSIDYTFTPQTNFFFLHEKKQHKRVFGIEGKLYIRVTF